MKNLKLLLVVVACFLTSITVMAQGTKDAPQPGSKFTYGLSSADNGNYTWWVCTDASDPINSKLNYGTDYTITGYGADHPSSIANLKSVEITWGTNLATLATPLYVFVEAEIAGCTNTRYYTVTPTNTIELALVNVTGSATPATSDGTDNVSGNHCPEFGGSYSSEDGAYNAGTTQVQVRIDRSSSVAGWNFDFAVSGAGVTASNIACTTNGTSAGYATGTVTASADADYVLVTFDVDNVPGTALSITCTISNASDDNSATATITTASVTHDLKVMPAIGSFN